MYRKWLTKLRIFTLCERGWKQAFSALWNLRALLPLEYNEKLSHQLTEQVKQVRQRTWLMWSAGLTSGDSLGPQLKQHFIESIHHLKDVKGLKRKFWQNETQNISNARNHSPGEHKSSAAPPDCESLTKTNNDNCSTARAETWSKRSSRSVTFAEPVQVRYMRVPLWKGECPQISVTAAGSPATGKLQEAKAASGSVRERETRLELKWQSKNGILALSLNLNHRVLLHPELVSEPHPVSVLGPASTPSQLCLWLGAFINGSVEDGVRQLQPCSWLPPLLTNAKEWAWEHKTNFNNYT